MKNKVENPKVFISYAWGSKDYQDKVLSFATSLMQDGIDVLFDKWNLKEGNDTYAFMEKSVTDESVTNVLLLLDPVYEEKANSKQGGVGTETQIISPEVYNKTEQTKILPVVFERKEDGSIPKPVYLRQTLHFDLSVDDKYDDEYQRLVKRLYGVEIYKKPEIGNKPDWVEKDIDATVAKRVTKYDVIRKLTSENDRKVRFKEEVNSLKSILLKYEFSRENGEQITMYDELQTVKNDYLSLFLTLPYAPQSIDCLADSFESIYFELNKKRPSGIEIKLTLLHELFIYLVAICYKHDMYSELGYMLNRSYYSGKYRNELENFTVFYHHNDLLDRAICERDNKKYLSGTASYWMDRIAPEACTKDEVVFADILCYNVSIFIHKEYKDWYWFPITYVYRGNEIESPFRRFSIGLKSKEKLDKAALLFGFDKADALIARFKDIKEDRDLVRSFENIRYPASFDSPDNVFHFVAMDELGTKK